MRPRWLGGQTFPGVGFALSLSKKSDSLKKYSSFYHVLTVFHCLSPFYAQQQITSVALRSVVLFYRATGAVCYHRSLQKSDREWFAHVALKKEQKMSNALEKPESEVPTLEISGILYLLRHANNEKISIIKKNSSVLFPFNRIQRPIILDWIWGKGCRTCRGSGLLFFKGPGGIFANNDSLALAFRCSFKNYKL